MKAIKNDGFAGLLGLIGFLVLGFAFGGGAQSYSPVGGKYVMILCDPGNNDKPYKQFMRTCRLNGTQITFTDTELDGTTAYAPTGDGVECGCDVERTWVQDETDPESCWVQEVIKYADGNQVTNYQDGAGAVVKPTTAYVAQPCVKVCGDLSCTLQNATDADSPVAIAANSVASWSVTVILGPITVNGTTVYETQIVDFECPEGQCANCNGDAVNVVIPAGSEAFITTTSY